MEIPQPENKKIVYIINQFYMHGGIQRMISNKIDAWIDHFGYDVIVVTLSQSGEEVVYPPKNNFKLINLGIPNANQHKIKDLISFASKLKKVLKQEKPDLVITTLTGIPSLLLPFIQPKIKKVLEIHSSGALSVTKSWKYKWWFLGRYHKVALLNEDEKQYYKLNNLIVIPNFFSPNQEMQIDYKNRSKIIIAAGRIHPDKQYDHLIKIWEKIYKNHPDWNLEIYGNGEEEFLKEYLNYINHYNIERINFLPATSDLEKIMHDSSILCLTSKTESFGMVLLECKWAMLPAISYDSPNGPRHIISNDGILVEHNNIEQFASELSNLILDEEKRKELAENAFQNRERFSAKEVIKKWNELL